MLTAAPDISKFLCQSPTAGEPALFPIAGTIEEDDRGLCPRGMRHHPRGAVGETARHKVAETLARQTFHGQPASTFGSDRCSLARSPWLLGGESNPN